MQTQQPYTEALEKALGGVIARANAELAGLRERMDAVVASASARVAEADARLAAIDARIAERLQSVKDGEPGASVTVEDVAPLIMSEVARAVAALPAAKDGTSVTLDDVRPILQEMIAALPAAKDGTSVTIEDVMPSITQEIEARIAELPPAEPGKSVTIDEVRPLLQEMVDALPAAKDGTSVTLGDVAPVIEAEVARQVAALPAPRDGTSVTVDDVRPMLQAMVDALPVPKDGEPGARGPEGRLPLVKAWEDRVFYEGDVVAHKGSTYQASKDTGREPPNEDWICIAAAGRNGDDGKSFEVRGTFDPNVNDYRKFDVVACGGAAFVARRDEPGACPGEGWKLIAMQGKTGKPGERGVPGPRGNAGPGVVALDVTGQGLLTLTNGDGTKVNLDLYPLLSKLQG